MNRNKRGLYMAASTAIVCSLLAGTTYFKTQKDAQKKEPKTVNETVEGRKTIARNALATATPAITVKPREKTVKTHKKKAVTAPAATKTRAYDKKQGMLWPVEGEILLQYSMENIIYRKTLGQYQCYDAIAVAAKQGQDVKSAYRGQVEKVYQTEEEGKMVQMDLGGGIKLVYGQLDKVQVKKGEEIKEGQIIGTVAKTTSYYAEEGDHLYFQVLNHGKPDNPLLYLR